MFEIQFKELYKLYQETMLRTFEDAVSEKGWRTTKRKYGSNYSRDLAALGLSIKGNGVNEEAQFSFKNSWIEVLFIDRDEIPLRFDMRILDKNFGLMKTARIASEKAEVMDALIKGDRERVEALGKMMGRIKGPLPIDPKDPTKGSVLVHFENGEEQSDSGSIIRKEEKDES